MDKKEKILIAASKVFRKYGLNKTKLTDIGKESGYNSSSLYYYFDNKEDLLQQMVLYDMEKIKRSLVESLEDSNNLKEGLEKYLITRVEEMDIIKHYEEILHNSVISPPLRLFLINVEKELRAFEHDILQNFVLKNSKKYANNAAVIVTILQGVSMKLTISRSLDREGMARIGEKIGEVLDYLLPDS